MSIFNKQDRLLYEILRKETDKDTKNLVDSFFDARNFAMEHHDTGDDEGIVSEGIGAFGRAIIKVIEELYYINIDPFFGERPFEPGSNRASDFFAAQGELSKAIWHLCAYVPRHEFQRFIRNHPDDAKYYISSVCKLVARLHNAIAGLYPESFFVRPFAHLQFLLQLHYSWLWVNEDKEPFIFKVMAYVVNLSLDECNRLMREFEGNIDRSYSDRAVDDYLQNVRRNEFNILPNSRVAITEESLLSVIYSPEPQIRCLELSAVLLQYACCMMGDYLKEGQAFYSGGQTAMPKQRMSELLDSCSVVRHSLRFITECFCEAIHLKHEPVEQVKSAHSALLGILERFEMLNLPPSVLSSLRDTELAANDYFRMVMNSLPTNVGISDAANQLTNELFNSMDRFTATLRTFEFEQSTRSQSANVPLLDSAALKEIMRVALSNERKLDAIQTGQDAAARKLETIRKDVKFVKAEQDSPSHDSKRHGPPPKYPQMVEDAINLLKEWGKKNPAPNPAIAAREIFNRNKKDEKEGRIKRGNRYTNLKSFQVIVGRRWAKPES